MEWYHQRAEEARRLAQLLRQRKEEGAPEEELRRIERDLDRARYVGD